MCLSQVEDLDTRFAEAVRGVVPADMKRDQLLLRMGGKLGVPQVFASS